MAFLASTRHGWRFGSGIEAYSKAVAFYNNRQKKLPGIDIYTSTEERIIDQILMNEQCNEI